MPQTIPLRERKHIQTRKKILEIFLKKIKEKPIESITVKEICDQAHIATKTFFNYFPQKNHLLSYYIKLWAAGAGGRAEIKLAETKNHLKAIEEIFNFTAEQIEKGHEKIIKESMSHLLKNPVELKKLSRAECLAFFPKKEKIREATIGGFNEIAAPLLESAIKNKELPEKTPIEPILIALRTVFFGVPMAITEKKQIKKAYQDHLTGIWTSLHYWPKSQT